MDPISSIPQLAALIEKGGIIGLLLVVATVLAWEIRRLRKENAKVYAQRDRWRLAYTICKAACDAADVKPDLSELNDLLKDNGEPA